VHQFDEVFAPSFIALTVGGEGTLAHAKLSRDERDNRCGWRLPSGEHTAWVSEVERHHREAELRCFGPLGADQDQVVRTERVMANHLAFVSRGCE
jgi:hypothetical protein